MKKTLFSILFLFVFGLLTHAQSMTNEKMGKLIGRVAQITKESDGYWEFIYRKRPLVIITDKNANRMRIITPVAEEKSIKKKTLTTILNANFDKALDAKYALFNGYLWSVFTHPLAELYDEQFVDAISQVEQLATNYGTTYTSTNMTFGSGGK